MCKLVGCLAQKTAARIKWYDWFVFFSSGSFFLVACCKLCLKLLESDEFIIWKCLDRDHLRTVHSENLEVLSDLLRLTWPLEYLGQCNSNTVIESLTNHSSDFSFIQICSNVEDLAGWDKHALDCEFEVHWTQTLNLVEVEQVKKDCNECEMFEDLHRSLSSALESAKVIRPAKSSRASTKPKDMSLKVRITVVVGVPDCEGRLVWRKDRFELSQIDGKVVANRFESAVEFSDFAQTKIDHWTNCFYFALSCDEV